MTIKVGDWVTYEGERGEVARVGTGINDGGARVWSFLVVQTATGYESWPADECQLCEEGDVSEKDETLSVLFYQDRDAWYEAVGDRMDVLWRERQEDNLVLALETCQQTTIDILTADNEVLRATIATLTADVAALRAVAAEKEQEK
jgi:hypothetical protein